MMNIHEIADLAKQGGRLNSDAQWVLADELATVQQTLNGGIPEIARLSGRNESTLLQYARASERWPVHDRVQGVSFSAHRVALSWVDPPDLLRRLKAEFGSPTVEQVRRAMGLEVHPALEHLRKAHAKLTPDVLPQINSWIIELNAWVNNHKDEFNQLEDERLEDERKARNLVLEEHHTIEDIEEANTPVAKPGKWTPPIRTSDVSGI